MVDPWTWTLSTTLVVIGWAVSLAIAVAGWVITAVRDRNAARTASAKAKADAKDAQRRFDAQLDVLKGQLQAANDSADALRSQVDAQKAAAESLRAQVSLLERQARLAEAAAAVPVWGFEQSRPRSVVYEVRNRNAFGAFDERAEYNGDKSYELGDMPKGSSTSFDFVESAIWGGVQTDITISWLPSPDATKREHLRMAMPARL